MYYLLIVVSVVMFGANFALSDIYRKMRGSTVKCSLESTLYGGIAGIVVLLLINGISVQLTPFALFMALWSALNGFAFTFCGFKALEKINLSLYSLFSMLGGMLLPFIQGIIFYGEPLTLAKALCFLFICAALALTAERGQSKGGGIYYFGIFILNGMSGVITKLYNSAPFEKSDSASYSLFSALWGVMIAAILLLTFFRKKQEQKTASLKSVGVAALSGSISRVANFILVLSLIHVESSVQYPMVTGGVMIVSTLICLFGKSKPKKKELISVALAFIGLLILFLLPLIFK